jgi:hypothetical protein
MYEVFDLNEKLLLSSINLMKSKQIKANLKSRRNCPILYGKKYKTCCILRICTLNSLADFMRFFELNMNFPSTTSK